MNVNVNRSMSMLDDLVKEYGMKKVNSMTKYPSILTYHDLYKGIALNTLTEGKTFAPDAVLEITEKVDGMNSRLIYLDGDFIIGEKALSSQKEIVFRIVQLFLRCLMSWKHSLIPV